MKMYQIGFTGIIAGILLIGLSRLIEELGIMTFRFTIGLGGVGMVIGAIIIYLDYLLGISKEDTTPLRSNVQPGGKDG